MSGAIIAYYPEAGVVVHEGETVEQAFRRAYLSRARGAWRRAEEQLERLEAARGWWEEPTPEGRT